MPAGSFTADITTIRERSRQKTKQAHAGGTIVVPGA
jgi:hypothetical protein